MAQYVTRPPWSAETPTRDELGSRAALLTGPCSSSSPALTDGWQSRQVWTATAPHAQLRAIVGGRQTEGRKRCVEPAPERSSVPLSAYPWLPWQPPLSRRASTRSRMSTQTLARPTARTLRSIGRGGH